MKNPALLCICLVLCAFAGGCSVGASAQLGYTQMAVSGDLGLTTGALGVPSSAHQDIESAFGLGDPQGSPYVRAQTDLGFAVLTGSGFLFSEKGTGRLDADFGGISAGTPVESSLDFANAKVSMSFDFGIGPVKVSPGLAVDVFDVNFRARETSFGNTEEVDQVLFVPLLFLRAEADLAGVKGIAEVGYLKTPEVDNAEAEVLDLELLAEVQVVSNLSAFVGYRLIDLQGKGDSDGDSFDIDLQVSGWMIGGVLRF
ncbi:MAG: hypothetical protein H6838_03270 [Planctomycetes bacterium]|nr:hypothetical protein [Planctomycetota bacterium]MCB9884483.1 hypothetical protein [Planctomycetota bacterium]